VCDSTVLTETATGLCDGVTAFCIYSSVQLIKLPKLASPCLGTNMTF